MRKSMISVAAILLVACRTHAAEPAKVEPAKVEPAAVAAKEDGLQVIILGGGKEAAEAEAWKKRWEDDVAALYREVIELQEGYPRTVRSDDLPGLNPGYQIAILGICKATEAAAPLALIKSIYPGAYARKITGSQPEACPELPTQAKVHYTETLKQDGWRLAVNVYFRQPGVGDAAGERREPPDPKSGYFDVVTTMFDPQEDMRGHDRSKLYESMPDLLDVPSSCELALTRSSKRIVVRASCDREAQSCSGNVSHYVEQTTYSVDGERLQQKEKLLDRQATPLCD